MMKHLHSICLLLASTREWLANRNTLKVLTKLHDSKSILQFASNCIYVSDNVYNQAKLNRPRLTTHSLLLKAAFTVSTMPVLSGSFL